MKFSDGLELQCAARRARAYGSGLLTFLALVLAAPAAHAVECLLPPVSVPGLSGAPQWFTSGVLSVRKELDDPRWGGAPLVSFANDPVGTTAAYRVLVHGNELNVWSPIRAAAVSEPRLSTDASFASLARQRRWLRPSHAPPGRQGTPPRPLGEELAQIAARSRQACNDAQQVRLDRMRLRIPRLPRG